MSGEAGKHTVLIFEETYTILSDESFGAVSDLAQRVDDLMRKIARKSGSSDVKRIAVMTALHLTHELKSFEDVMAKQKTQESHLVDYINRELSSLT